MAVISSLNPPDTVVVCVRNPSSVVAYTITCIKKKYAYIIFLAINQVMPRVV